MLPQSMTTGVKKHIKADDVFLPSLFMSAFASETSKILGDLAPEDLCVALIHLLNDISRPEYD